MLVSAESQVPKLISREIIFLRNSNACDHNSPTSQTDGQTDRQLIMAIPRYATRGNKSEEERKKKKVFGRHRKTRCGGAEDSSKDGLGDRKTPSDSV